MNAFTHVLTAAALIAVFVFLANTYTECRTNERILHRDRDLQHGCVCCCDYRDVEQPGTQPGR